MHAKPLLGPVQYVYCMQNKAPTKPTISLRLPPELLEEVDDLARRTGMTRTGLVEHAVRAYAEGLRETVVAVRPWTEPRARAAIAKFLRSRPSAYVSEIVEALRMDPELAWRVIDSLVAEGRVE